MNIGDKVTPIETWNGTSTGGSRLDKEVVVLDVEYNANSQTGILYKVRDISGHELWLDSAWFEE